jgi:hypothetical protein
MYRMLSTEGAKLLKLQSVGSILLIFGGCIIPVFTFGAG